MKNLLLIFSLISVCLLGSIAGFEIGVNPIYSGLATGCLALLSGLFKFIPNGALGVSVCGEIASNIAFDCNTPLQSGTSDRAWIINFNDIDSVTYNATNKKIVEAITLSGSNVAYYIDGKNNSIAPKATMLDLTYVKPFDHMVNMKGFDISPDIKDQLDKAKDGRFVVIVENKFKGTAGNSAFEIYGLSVGLEMTVLERDPNNAELLGAFDFTFMTKTDKEPGLPHSFYITSYAASKTAIEALLVP